MAHSKPSKRPRFELNVTLLLPKDLLGYLLSFLKPREVCATRVCRAWRDNKASYRKMKGLIEHVFAVCAPGSLRSLTCVPAFLQTVDLAQFTRLESLELVGCTLMDEQLASLAFVQLTTLNFASCSGLTGQGLSHVYPLHLRNLNLSSWQLSSQVVRCIAKMKRLSTLTLKCCSGLKTAHIETMSRLPFLMKLDLTDQENSRSSVLALGNAARLQFLSLKNCLFVRTREVVDFAKMERLVVLDLFSCAIEDAAMEFLPRNLLKLDLGCCMKLSSKGIAHLPKTTPRLRHLRMANGPYTRKTVAFISELTELQTLDISQSYPRNQACSRLAALTKLEKLVVSPNSNSFKNILKVASLKSLVLVGCGPLTKEELKPFLGLPNLQSVCLVQRLFMKPGEGKYPCNHTEMVVNRNGHRVFW